MCFSSNETESGHQNTIKTGTCRKSLRVNITIETSFSLRTGLDFSEVIQQTIARILFRRIGINKSSKGKKEGVRLDDEISEPCCVLKR